MTGQESRKKVSYYRQPEDMTVDQWQAELRKQFASTQQFRITNMGTHPVYSDFQVFNPESDKTYKVSIRTIYSALRYGRLSARKARVLITGQARTTAPYMVKNMDRLNY